jgi:hypothetical protein
MPKHMKSGHTMTYVEGTGGKPGKYVYTHRLEMEKKLGRKLRPNEIVHHKDGKPGDNASTKNLEVVTRGEHNTIDPELHHGGRHKGDKNK